MSDDVIVEEKKCEDKEEASTSEISAIHRLAGEGGVDIFVISGHIDYILADRLIDAIGDIEKKKSKAAVFLCTLGGDADAAYLIARTLQEEYSHTTLYISGFCKSAGTLIALGVNEIAMGSKGELGPLDVQLRIEDSFFFTFTSGLGSAKSIEYLQSKASDSFWDCFTKLTKVSERSFTAQTTAKIATELVVGLLGPITRQIDPLRLAENQRALDVAKRYGLRLAAKGFQASEACIDQLVYEYPSHRQVIDLHEAKEIFGECVRPFSELETEMMIEAQEYMNVEVGRDGLRWPVGAKFGQNIVLHLNPVQVNDEAEPVVSNGNIEEKSDNREKDVQENTDDGNRETKAATQ